MVTGRCSRKVHIVANDEAIEHLLEQLAPLPVRARAMFGGYCLYCDEKIVALFGDDTLFIKPTAISPSFFTEADLAPPFPGARNYYAVPGDRFDDHEWIQEVVSRTAELLPLPKPKTRKGRANGLPR